MSNTRRADPLAERRRDRGLLRASAGGALDSPHPTNPNIAGHLLQMQDEERRRIARQLHDTTGQNLGALSMGLSMTLSNPRLDPATRKAIEENIALADTCIREIRRLCYQLHPPLLEELGLAAALRAYAGNYSETTGIALELDVPARLPRLPHPVEIALFRIVQEGLSNIHRHSGTRTAILRLKYDAGALQLTLTDRGHGFPESRVGPGIATMRERVRQLNGHITIRSGKTGTAILVTLHPQQLDAPVRRS